MKKIIFAGIVLLGTGLMIAAYIFFSAMTDPIPSQVRAGWYLPGKNIVWTTSGNDFESPGQERLILAGRRDASTPQFPMLSRFSRYENYTRLNSDEKYVIAAWYFNDERKFLESQKILVAFLETEGNISPVELNFTEHILRFEKSAPGQDSQNHTIPDHINATGYESVPTSGYFFTVTIPEQGYYAENKEYYIVWYGTTSPVNLTSQTQFLQDIIAETYRYDLKSTVGALLCGGDCR